MSFFQVVSILMVLAALFSFINYRYIHLPTTIGIMLIALVLSLMLLGLSRLGVRLHDEASHILGQVDFNEVVLHGMLAFLLFAGALHVDMSDLAREWGAVTLLATASTLVSTFLVGGLAWWMVKGIGFDVPIIHCLLFGALISPTDP